MDSPKIIMTWFWSSDGCPHPTVVFWVFGNQPTFTEWNENILLLYRLVFFSIHSFKTWNSEFKLQQVANLRTTSSPKSVLKPNLYPKQYRLFNQFAYYELLKTGWSVCRPWVGVGIMHVHVGGEACKVWTEKVDLEMQYWMMLCCSAIASCSDGVLIASSVCVCV